MILTDDAPILVDISDVHAGSSCAPLHPDFININQNHVGQNAFQRWLWPQWLDMIQWILRVVGNDRFSLVLNGDLIEGLHHHTTEVVSQVTSDHIKIAVELLRDVAERAERRYIVKGTECHTREVEDDIASMFGAVPCRITGKPAHDKLWLEQGGILIAASHHIGTTSRQALEATQLSIRLSEEQQQAARVGNPIPQVVLCAHRHVYGYYTDGDAAIVVTPGWQFLTRHGNKVVPASKQKFGCVVLDWRQVGDGSLPEVRERLYRYRLVGAPEDARLNQRQFASTLGGKVDGGGDATVGD